MSDAKKEGSGPPSPGKLFAYFVVVGIGLVILRMGAESLFEMSRSISMSFDMLTKPILVIIVILGLLGMFSSDKGSGKEDKH
ncbi:hypothetical protein K9M47_00175 [Candidatus Gracilibacteria bacterium]|nr:hypothetical protein [Candidatus Gracilibacteria bacterium]MCF7898393.1 hypothetical protein [Candidatus Paceibacterota bacterium]